MCPPTLRGVIFANLTRAYKTRFLKLLLFGAGRNYQPARRKF